MTGAERRARRRRAMEWRRERLQDAHYTNGYASCPYLMRLFGGDPKGVCSMGCWEEPVCTTNPHHPDDRVVMASVNGDGGTLGITRPADLSNWRAAELMDGTRVPTPDSGALYGVEVQP